MNAEGGGFSVPSPSSPITETLDSLMQSSDANSTAGGLGSGNARRRGAPRSGPRGVSLLTICNPNPGPSSVTTIHAASIMDVKPRIAQRRQLVAGLTCRPSSNAGGSQSDNLQVPSGSGSGARGRGSRGRAPRGRASFGQGSGIKRDNNMNPRQRHGMGPPPRIGAE